MAANTDGLDLEYILGRGYFPKELPPPFTTWHFASNCSADHAAAIAAFDGAKPTRLAAHTLGLAGGRRRALGLPNPITQYALASEIASGWNEIWPKIEASPYSLSKPERTAGRALAPTVAFQNVPRERAPLRARGNVLVRVDVAQYYPSVYSHSIPWALHGKRIAKRKRGNDLLGNRLDAALRATQDGQTIGIPIGPDTSLVIAELLLSQVDQAVHERFKAPGSRHMDDFEFSVKDIASAEEIRAGAQEALAEYELNANTEKTGWFPLPQPLERPWIVELRSMRLSSKPKAQYYDIVRFHDRAVELARLHPNENVLKYALGRLDRLDVHGDNSELFIALILQFVSAEYGVVPNALPILEKMQVNEELGDKALVEDALSVLIASRAQARVSNDVAWALWAAISLECALSNAAAAAVAAMDDSVVCLLALHAREVGLMKDDAALKAWSAFATKTSLAETRWLLAYEGSERGWLGSARPAKSVKGFDFLVSKDVRFYDETSGEDQESTVGFEDGY